jgi:GTP-binding protein YchF
MRAGLAGYARSGKTTLFNALTGLHRGPESRVHLGAIKVPDARLDKLSAMFKPKKTTPAEVLLADLPGPRAKGASLESEALQALREVDALCLVLRAFPAEAPPDPVRDLRDYDAELILSDLQVAEKRLHRLKQERNTGGETQELQRLSKHLEGGTALRGLTFSDAEEQALAQFGFLSRKPLLVVANVPEEDAAKPVDAALAEAAKALGAEAIALSAEVEAEISQLPPEEQPEYLASLGISEPARARFLSAVYSLLHQISFFTVGEDEVRAWTIKKGDKAARAAGKIHSDLEKSFVRAEVMHYEDFLAAGNEHRARELGKLRLEGKDYVVHDGDILTVRAGRAK